MRASVLSEIKPEKVKSLGAGDVMVQALLGGKDGDPGNFDLRLDSNSNSHGRVRHRHNFEQIRWVLDGRFTLAPGKFIEAGEIGYFTEGVYYGGESDCNVLALQFGGPSGYGVMSVPRVQDGRAALAKTGVFENGVYTWYDAEGRKHNQDPYEAVWEFFNKKKIQYLSRPRYADVTVINPKAYLPRTVQKGVKVYILGTFSEALTSLRLFEAEAGARLEFGHERQPTLLILRTGMLKGPARSYSGIAAFHLEPGERQSFEAEQVIELLEINLPDMGHLAAAA